MAHIIEFTEPAVTDLSDARGWYELRRVGLGDELVAEVEATLRKIAESPGRFPIVLRDTRRALVDRFPCSIPFRVIGEKVTVLGVIHGRRNPGLMRRRIIHG
jgi:plasmid stabilization system protein ParE